MIMQDSTLVELQAGPQFLFLALVGFSTVSSPRKKDLLKAAVMDCFTEKLLKSSAWHMPIRFAPVAMLSAQKGPGLVKRHHSG